MNYVIQLLKDLFELIKEPLIFYLGTLQGKSDAKRDNQIEAQSAEIKDLHRYVVLSNAHIDSSVSDKLRDKYAADE